MKQKHVLGLAGLLLVAYFFWLIFASGLWFFTHAKNAPNRVAMLKIRELINLGTAMKACSEVIGSMLQRLSMERCMRRLNHITTLFFVLLFLGNLQAQEPVNPSVKEPALRRELLKLVEQDQAIRNELISKGVENPDKAILARMHTIDTANTKRMRAIVRKHGWPSPELIGRDGAGAAFLLVQHADLAFQKEMLPLVEKAYRGGGLSGESYALLLDRVLVGEGKPQVFGTQAKRLEEWKGQEPALHPIKDEANVDKRRAEVGLPPLSEYRQFLKRMYFPQRQGKP